MGKGDYNLPRLSIPLKLPVTKDDDKKKKKKRGTHPHQCKLNQRKLQKSSCSLYPLDLKCYGVLPKILMNLTHYKNPQ